MKRLPLVVSLLLVVVRGLAGPVGAARDDQNFARASGAELARALVPSATRVPALRELCRRAAKPGADEERPDPAESEPETIVCPQADGADPLYLVLYRFGSSQVFYPGEEEGYPITHPSELFPPEPPIPGIPDAAAGPSHPPLERRSDLVILVFNSRGELVTPFCRNNMIEDGVFADFTGDGGIERADPMHYRIDGVKTAEVLTVSRVEAPAARPLLSVLINWGDEDGWGYEFARRGEDGTVEVRLGPKTGMGEDAAIRPEKTFRWDPARKGFVGPPGGGPGEHFFVLPTEGELFFTVDALRGKLPPFPAVERLTASPAPAETPRVADITEPPGPPPAVAIPHPEPVPPPLPPVTLPALDKLSDEELLRFFGPGRNVTDDVSGTTRRRRASIAVPANFWEGPPREVALALAELNRTAAHRASYRLAVDDRDGAAPPAEGSLRLGPGFSRYAGSEEGLDFLRFGPAGEPSYFVHLGRSDAGTNRFEAVKGQPDYDLRWCELNGADARQLAAVTWWLDRVRSRPHRGQENHGGGGRMRSTGDRGGTLWMTHSGGGPALRLNGMVFNERETNPVAGRWTGNYDPEIAFNLAAHLLDEALPARLGAAWSDQAPLRPGGTPKTGTPETGRRHALAARILALSPAGQRRGAYALSRGVVEMVGNLGWDDLDRTLEELEKQLPPAAGGDAGRTLETIREEIKTITRPPRAPADPGAEETARAREAALEHEGEGVVEGTDEPRAAEDLRGAIHAARQQLAAAHDPAALAAIAAADPDSPAAVRAMQQLRRLGERARVAGVLEGWLTRSDEANTARYLFAALAEAAPDRARHLAEALPADQPRPLFVSAFALLAKDGAVVPDGDARRRTLVVMLLDPETAYDQRVEIMRLLVPDDAPGRYSEPDIDAALRRMLDEPALVEASSSRGYVLAVAAEALARRGHGEDFERIFAHADDPDSGNGRFLDALALLLPHRGPEGARKLETFLREQLTAPTRLSTDALLLNAWITDQRALGPVILRLATANPEEVESPHAHRHGGDSTPLAGARLHLARQVAALWGEDQDALTRAKALVAFALHYYVSDSPRRERFTAELGRAARDLTPEAREAVGAFLDWGEAKERAGTGADDAQTGEPQESVRRHLVRTTLGLSDP